MSASEQPAAAVLDEQSDISTAQPKPASEGAASQKSGLAVILQAINGVMRDAGGLQKNGTNKFHKYDYLTADDVQAHYTPLLAEHGLIIAPTEYKREGPDSHGNERVTFDFRIFHVSGEAWPLPNLFTGTGNDRSSKGDDGDKAYNKARTAAYKQFMISQFGVYIAGANQDSEADHHQDQARDQGRPRQQQRQAPPTDQQRRQAHQDAQAPASKLDPQLVNALYRCETLDALKAFYNDAGTKRALGDPNNRTASGQELMDRIQKHKADLTAGGVFLTDMDGVRSNIMAPAAASEWLQTNIGHGADRAKAKELIELNAEAIQRLDPGNRTDVLKAAVQAHGQEILGQHFDQVPVDEPA